ncbi:alpha/beta fold hydrolase [Spirochaeta dissipatitropha]
MNFIGKQYESSSNLVLLIHGQEASSADWIEKDGFTKGGNLTEGLDSRSISWLAPDLYGHGSFTALEAGFDSADISDDLWPLFLSRSADAAATLIEGLVKKHRYRELTVISYSAGCHVAVKLLQRNLPLPVNKVFMAAPCPEREYNDEYSLHNNLDCFFGRASCFFTGSTDETSPIDDVRWLYSQIIGTQKELLVYESGHSLPVDWTGDALARLDSSGS